MQPSDPITHSATRFYLRKSNTERLDLLMRYSAKAAAGECRASARACALNLIRACEMAEERAPYRSVALHDAAITASLARLLRRRIRANG